MKKPTIVALASLMLLGMGLSGCGTQKVSSSTTAPVSSTSETTKVSVTLDKTTLSVRVDEEATLTATTNPAGGTVKFSSSDTSIATVTKAGVVKGVKEGKATITATTKDNLTATCAVTVTAQAVPSIPTTDTHAVEIPLSSPSLDTAHKDGFAVNYKDSLTTISFTAASLSSSSWNNTAIFNLPTTDVSRKTEFHLIAKGSEAMTIYYKILASEDIVGEGQIAFGASYTDEKVTLPTANRYLLSSATQLLIYAPKPGSYTKEGSFIMAHAYLTGDDEPGIAPGAYDPSKYDVIYSFPVTSETSLTAGGLILDQITGKDSVGNCTVTYRDNGITFTNKDNFNDWGDYSLKCPEYNGDTKLDYSKVAKLVAKFSASEGAVIKYRDNWDGTLQEKHVKAADTKADFYLTIDESTITPWSTIFEIAPLYRDSGYTADLTITLKSVQVVSLKA